MITYEPKKGAFFTEGISMTEQEHIHSCDINLMIKSINRGHPVRTSKTGPWANDPKGNPGHYDDTTIDPVTLRIQKQKIEADLAALAASGEISEDEVKHIPDHIRKKFDFKTHKKDSKKPAVKNDDKTTKKSADPEVPVSDQVEKPSSS